MLSNPSAFFSRKGNAPKVATSTSNSPLSRFLTIISKARVDHQRLEKMPDPKIRRAVNLDEARVRKIDQECWSSNLWLKDKEFKWYFENYREGQFVVEVNEKVVGCLFTQRIEEETDIERKTSKDLSSLHSGKGKIVQLLRISVSPQFQGLGLSHAALAGPLSPDGPVQP